MKVFQEHDATLAILCGGRSARLGTDKGLYQPLADEPLFARAVRVLGGSCKQVLLVTRDAAQRALYQSAVERFLSDEDQRKVAVVSDDQTGIDLPEATLAGVFTAVKSARETRVIVVPVDQVGVRPLHLGRLLQAQAKADDTRPAAFANDADDFLPYPSVWRAAHAERLAALIQAGALSVKGALGEFGATAAEAADFAEELAFNGNTKDELADYFGDPLFDPFKRRLHYLRFSLTEACNLSCTYCLPEGFPEWYRHKARLGREDIDTLLRGFRRLGFRKVRLTGGEPTVHPDCLATVALARRIGYERIAMTTNGLLIHDLDRWVDAGLNQLNVSLDALDSDRFYAVTRSREVDKVRRVIEGACERGLDVKVNTVLLRTKNGDTQNIESLIDWALSLPLTLRFIELMETKLNGSFSGTERVLGTEIEPYLASRGLAKLDPNMNLPDLRGPATDYGSREHLGRVGLINPMSCNFCSKCNRLRITAKGRLKLCLFGDQDIPLDLASPDAVALSVRRLIDRKPERHYLDEGNVGNVATFRTIGG